MKEDPIRLRKVWGLKDGWFAKILRDADRNQVALPCVGKERLYGAVTESPIARRAAAQNCLTGFGGSHCPILAACAKAGKDSQYKWNVWGGKFQNQPVPPVSPRTVQKWMRETLRETDGSQILKVFSIGIPSLQDLLNEEGGSDLVYMQGECLSLRHADAKTAVLLRRRLANEALLLRSDAPGTAMIELSCAEYSTCISPWHFVWSKEPVNIIPHTTDSRCVALALYLTMENSWNATNASGLTGIHRLYVSQLMRAASLIGMDEALVVGNVSDSVTWYQGLTGRAPYGQELSAMLTLVRAAQELSCMTIREILAVGKEEF